MQRLLAQSVAGNQQRLAAIIPQRKSEHAPLLLHTFRPHVFVKMDDGFCIAVRGEMMAARFKLWAEFRKVVDFAVENDPGGTIFVEDGLMSTGKINNAQTTHSQTDVLPGEQALVIRAAMHDGLAHLVDEAFLDPFRPV